MPVSLQIPPDLLREAEAHLLETDGDITGLSPRHRRAIPFLLWTSEHRWSEHRRLVTDLLDWAASHWRSAPARLFAHQLLNLDPDSFATEHLAAWLHEHRGQLPERLRVFFERWGLVEPGQAVRKIGKALLSGSSVIEEIEGLGVEQEKLRRSALLLRALDALGRELRGYQESSQVAPTLTTLLAPLGDTPTYKMQGSDDARRQALRSLVEGLVLWADRLGEPAIGPTLDLLYRLVGDPRLRPERWQTIDADIRKTVERWLTKITLESFFRFMRETPTDNPTMVKERVAFWRDYEHDIKRAWLIVGKDSHERATSVLKDSFADFAQGPNVQPDHLGLLMQMRNLIVLEMNKQGRTLFWPAADSEMPGFYQREYNRSKLLQQCSSGDHAERFSMTHHPGWQLRYRQAILDRTKVFPF